VVVDEDGTAVVVVVDVELVVVVVVGGGPEETAMSTVLPGDTLAPVPGFDDTTKPGWNWVDGTEVTFPTASPALAKVWPATG